MYQHTIQVDSSAYHPPFCLSASFNINHPCILSLAIVSRSQLSPSHIHRQEYKIGPARRNSSGWDDIRHCLYCITQWCIIIRTASFSVESHLAFIRAIWAPLCLLQSIELSRSSHSFSVDLPYAYRRCPSRVALRDESRRPPPRYSNRLLSYLILHFYCTLTSPSSPSSSSTLPATRILFTAHCPSPSVPSCHRHRQCCNIARLIAPSIAASGLSLTGSPLRPGSLVHYITTRWVAISSRVTLGP